MTDDGIELLDRLKPDELEGCLAVIAEGNAVDLATARIWLPRSLLVALRREGDKIVAVGAIKPERKKYAAGVAAKSGFAFDPAMIELGYVAVKGTQQNKGLSGRITTALLRKFGTRSLFATTPNRYMERTLKNCGFVQRGKSWKGNEGNTLSLWLREADALR